MRGKRGRGKRGRNQLLAVALMTGGLSRVSVPSEESGPALRCGPAWRGCLELR